MHVSWLIKNGYEYVDQDKKTQNTLYIVRSPEVSFLIRNNFKVMLFTSSIMAYQISMIHEYVKINVNECM